MEYVIGPVLALLLAARLSTYQKAKCGTRTDALEKRLDNIEKIQKETNQELPKKLIAAMMPITSAVKTLNEEVGISKGYN